VMGRTTAFIYLATVFVGAIVSGILFDALSKTLNMPLVHDMTTAHSHEPENALVNLFWAILLAVIVVHSMYGDRLYRLWKKEDRRRDVETADAKQIILAITGMTCSHCANAVKSALNNLKGVSHAEVDLAAGKATITGEDVNPDTVINTVTSLGYKAERIP
jgi:copper chaperone CopZ